LSNINENMDSINRHPNFIKELEITNFKSIKHTKLINKRINIFIGEPNTGKSNILEALGLASALGHRDFITDYIRVSNYDQLYYNEYLDKEIVLSILRNDESFQKIELNYNNKKHYIKVNEMEKGWVSYDKHILEKFDERSKNENGQYGFSLISKTKHDPSHGEWFLPLEIDEKLQTIKYYKFRNFHPKNFQKIDHPENVSANNNSGTYSIQINAPEIHSELSLKPPNGENIYSVINNSEKNQKEARDLFRDFNMKLHLVKYNERVEAQKEIEGVVKSYQLFLLADTLQSLLFYYMAIVSNKHSIIILEEPEAHTFPTHTRELAMKIVEDETNQYFIATHNPYVLNSLIEKGKDVQINFVRQKNGVTEVKQLSDNQLSFLMNRKDIFSALTHYDDWPEHFR
jgi:AAA15 family ATPase/GTPase